jgi:hypothetical protein
MTGSPGRGFAPGAAALVLLAAAQAVSGMVSKSSEGRWPSDWPAALEPYRAKATTTMVGTGIQEDIHEIAFESREEFERIWPVLCWLKSKGGTLTLLSPSNRDQGHGPLLEPESTANVRILCYTQGKASIPNGPMLSCSPPWPDTAYLPDGTLAEYVTISSDGKTWVPAGSPDAGRGFMNRARVDLEFIVDGEIIDLSRLRLPPDTRIVDKRELPGIAGKWPTTNPARYEEKPPVGFAQGAELPAVHYRSASPVVAMYVNHRYTRDRQGNIPRVIFAAWEDGYIVWSGDPLNGGAPYHIGWFEPARLEQLLVRMEQHDAFTDVTLNHHHWGPDASFTAIVVADPAKDRWLNMCSWHELMEENPATVVTERGAEALGERDRDEVIADLPESEQRYRNIWAQFRAGLRELVPDRDAESEWKAVELDFFYLHLQRD